MNEDELRRIIQELDRLQDTTLILLTKVTENGRQIERLLKTIERIAGKVFAG